MIKQKQLIIVALLALIYHTAQVLAVKEYLFRKCDQNPFCKRNRFYAEQIKASNEASPYSIDLSQISGRSDGVLEGTILKKINDKQVELPLTISFLEGGDSVRITVDEKIDDSISYENKDLTKHRYNELEQWVIDGNLKYNKDIKVSKTERDLIVEYGLANKLVITSNPFKAVFYRNNEEQVVLNDQGLLNFEHRRSKPAEGQATADIGPFELDEGLWEDTFDSKTDRKVRGPESVALDVSFIGYGHVYGIPEHADSLSLRDTKGKEPYRLFNVDIFEYETNSPMAMYGSIPFMTAQKKTGAAGVFWMNSADTYIDIDKPEVSEDGKVLSLQKITKTHWISETGLIDIFVFLGDTPEKINQLYSEVTGYAALPQSFAIGHHQCRWNYNSQEDVLEVNDNFDKHGIPYDVIWLDIEYAPEKQYFSWIKANFPDPVEMMRKLDETKRKLVNINDPHIKVKDDYNVYKDLVKQQLSIKDSSGNPYKGHCWPGESVWIDSLSPKAREFWTKLFVSGSALAGDATNFFIWNDMNEPSVFSGPETSANKDAVHYGGWEHRDVHNLYGLTFHNATAEALKTRYSNKQRPFVLTRSYFAGSQRIGPMWTGDNMAKWEYLKIATPMILTSGVAGMPFAGADVGGFFENPSYELLTRWYQAGAFYPFFRAHAHIDSKRREPWIPGGEFTRIIGDAIKLRYRLLPAVYTAFYETSKTGVPILKPIYYIAKENEAAYDIDDEFFLGDTGILVKPITEEGASATQIYLPDAEVYYDFNDVSRSIQGLGYHTYEAPLDTIPIVVRGGSIFATRERHRRSATLMKFDPFTINVFLNEDGYAKGVLYVDDGESFEYQNGEYLVIDLEYKDGELKVTKREGKGSKYLDMLWIEEIRIRKGEKQEIVKKKITLV